MGSIFRSADGWPRRSHQNRAALVLEVRLAVIGDGQWNPQTDIEQGVAVRPVAAENWPPSPAGGRRKPRREHSGRFDQQVPGDCPNFRVNENGTVPFAARTAPASTKFGTTPMPGPWAGTPRPLSAPLAMQRPSPNVKRASGRSAGVGPPAAREKELPRPKSWDAVDLLLLAVIGVLGVWFARGDDSHGGVGRVAQLLFPVAAGLEYRRPANSLSPANH